MVTGWDLRTARLAQRVGIGALARRIGRDKGHLSRVERGIDNRAVSPALIRDYEAVLGVTIEGTDCPVGVTALPAPGFGPAPTNQAPTVRHGSGEAGKPVARRLSLAAAEQASEQALAGNAYAYLAYQLVSAGRPGIDAAVRSCTAVGGDSPRAVRALMYERCAWAHARAGQPVPAERALANAEAALAEPPIRPDPDWAGWVDPTEVQIMTGRCWTELRRPLRAVPVLERALAAYDGCHARDKALYSTWLAEAYLDANEIEQAAVVARRVLVLARGIGSVRPRERIDELVPRFQPHRHVAEVADLIDLAGQ